MTRKQKRMLSRIALAAVLSIAVYCYQPRSMWALCWLIPYAVIAWDVLFRAIRNILHGQIFDENFLMALATVGALATGEYAEACAVMLFYQVGELFQSYAVGRSRKSIAALMDIRPDYANIEKDDVLTQVDPESVAVGDIIIVRPGEKIPLDGIVCEGSSAIDTAALTGEALPRTVGIGDNVISGCVNQSGLLHVRVTKPFGESTVSKILDLVENAGSKKAKAENFITKFSRYYTPCVVAAALLLTLIPPLFVGDWLKWLHRALIFLVISCPCALVISVPLSFFGGIGGASRRGILIKGGNYLEALAHIESILFDKTGTLTQGVFHVTAVHPDTISEAELLELAAHAEAYSQHPIAQSLRSAYSKPIDSSRIASVTDLPGRGIHAVVGGRNIDCGNLKLMESIGITPTPCQHLGTVVHIAADGVYAGHIAIGDAVKPDARKALADLKAQGVKRTVMLTGDAKTAAESVAAELGIDEVYAELMPDDKVTKAEALMQSKSSGAKLAFVGDGINDAPVLTRADIGIAMGAMGQDAAIEAADVVLMDDAPSKIPLAVAISKRTLRIVHQNIIFALGVKALVLIGGACGLAGMWAAVFADVGVSVLAILNSMRALRS